MNTHIRKLAGLTVILTAITGAARAAQEASVNVPFAFMAAGKLLPAGDYRFAIDRMRDMVSISSQGQRVGVLVTGRGEPVKENRSYLRFRRHGNEWFLQDVAVAGETEYVLPGRAEKEATAKGKVAESQAVADEIVIP